MDKWSHINISMDRTPMQINAYKSVRAALDNRLAQGEKNLKIQYRNGIPTTIANLSEN